MKVAVIGAGAVGVSVCQFLLDNGACDTLVLVDLNQEKAQGEILDFGHTTSLNFTRNVKMVAGGYADCQGAGIVIITAGAQIKQGQQRDELAQINVEITLQIARELEKVAPEAILVLATNPVDLVSRFIIANTGYTAQRVISAGCLLDTARFMKIVADHVELDPKNVQGYVLGEHGATSFIPWSLCSIGGLSFDDYCDMVGKPRLARKALLQSVKQAGFEIFNRKGNTNHGIAASVYRIVQAILFDEGSILPVGAYLEGQFGIEDCVLSVPCLVNRQGIATRLPYPLTSHELAQLHGSARHLKALTEQVRKQQHLA
ncbi:L-lactate dehydrogenase [Pseudaeromonas paramecii]|uniref:L-lactate dehydrogenase n=1 Tax=Pseudaeromonas paramecii TaxID=2138166 RepID=A0ABP8Q3F2_9GAMM